MLYEIEYQYLDSLNDGWRRANIIIYDSSVVGEGETIDYALARANEEDDWSGVDKLMTSLYGLKDEDICFYFDRNGIEDESLMLEIQKSFDIIINDYEKKS